MGRIPCLTALARSLKRWKMETGRLLDHLGRTDIDKRNRRLRYSEGKSTGARREVRSHARYRDYAFVGAGYGERRALNGTDL